MTQAAASDGPRLRRAGPDDLLAVWGWNNDPAVRAWSRQTEPIPLASHRAWFAGRLADPTAAIFIVEHGGDGVGVVRLEADRDAAVATHVISIALAPSARGRGLGRAAIGATCRTVAAGAVIEAWIAVDNPASVACFEAAGFAFREARSEGGRAFRVYTWRSSDAACDH